MKNEVLCPCCQRLVSPTHFHCQSGKVGGSATGKAKVRGNAAFYRRAQLKAAATRKRNNLLRRKQGMPVR